MGKVHFQTPISGSHLNLPDLPPESSAESTPEVIHAKSEQKGFSALKNCSETTKKMSSDASRQHVTSQSEKKYSFSLFGKSLIKSIKNTFRHSTPISRRDSESKPSLLVDRLLTTEQKISTKEENAAHALVYRLKTGDYSISTQNKQQLSFTIKQCFGVADGEPNSENLKKLLVIAPEFGKISEYQGATEALISKINELIPIINEKEKSALQVTGKNTDIPDNQIVPTSTQHIPSTQEQTLNQPQSKITEAKTPLDEILDALMSPTIPNSSPVSDSVGIDRSIDALDNILNELNENVESSSASVRTDAPVKDDLDLLMQDLDKGIDNSSAPTKTITPSDALNKKADEFKDEVLKLMKDI